MSTEPHGLRCMETPCTPCQIEDVLSEHRAMVSGDDDGWHVICSCGHNEVGFGVNAHLAAALADLLAARDRRVRAEALRDAAADTEQFAEETYGEWLFRRPTTEDYAEINALLKRERGHQLDGVAGACYHHALTVRAEMLREKAAEIEADA